MEILEVNISGIGLNVSSPKDNDYREAGDRLFQAFEEIGFVYITGHGVSSDIISKSMETSKDFFLLPEDSKKQILRDPEIQQGFVSAGQELFNSKLVTFFFSLCLGRSCYRKSYLSFEINFIIVLITVIP